jgi:NADH-quinone oxidoreductase subunit L
LPLFLIVIAPLAAAVICGILAITGRSQKIAPAISVAATALSAVAAFAPQYLSPGEVIPSTSATWLSIGQFQITLGVHLDHLALLMVCVVCSVSLLVQIYSIGYMTGETGFARYFAFLSLFTGSMLGLVVADNLFQLYVCWELVGICSYLLVGFWWHKPSAANAAKKAFIVTRFGDVGFLLGVLLLASAAGSFQFSDAETVMKNMAAGQASQTYSAIFSNGTLLWLIPILLFCGAVGKSAQFPLHVWLPDAMEGPTPVSALIHAATMVAAGVYMVARLMPIFEGSAIAMNTVLLIGAITALIAATIALVQNDIKKVMAYSTVSQLGYMMMGLGAGGMAAGMFHLTTHAMFKALLFLCAGSVIHALHHAADPNDMRQMGGLGSRMRVTKWTCLAGVAALGGFPFLSGFWSKDAILAALLGRSQGNPVATIGLVTAFVVAGLTGFYAVRMFMMTFAGEPRSEAAAHASESKWVMTGPLVILAVPSLLLGFYLHFGERFAEFLTGSSTPLAELPFGLTAVAAVMALAGMGFAYFLYHRPAEEFDPVQKMPAPIYRTFANLWGIDALWNTVGARGALAVGAIVAWFDRHVVDGLMNLIGWLFGRAGDSIRRTSNGQAQTYTAAMVGAIAVVVALFVLYESQISSGAAPSPMLPAAPIGVQSQGIR